MNTPAERADAVRRAAGWFDLGERGLLVARGADRLRWCDGMISGDLKLLAPGPERSGCEALLLTPQGRIASTLHVALFDDEIWLELPAHAREAVRQRLERYIIAEDVSLADESAAWRRFALEGPRAEEWLARALDKPPALAPHAAVARSLGGARVVIGAWGVSGERAYQVFAPPGAAEAVVAAVAGAAGAALVAGDAETLEVLRVEAGRPRLGAELDEEVLPAEAGLVGGAVSLTKGCYTGQEIVARMASRDAAAHRLVGFRFESPAPPAVGAEVHCAGASAGELTSACVSARAGAIGLGFVRRAHAEPGTAAVVGGVPARVAALPFVSPGPH